MEGRGGGGHTRMTIPVSAPFDNDEGAHVTENGPEEDNLGDELEADVDPAGRRFLFVVVESADYNTKSHLKIVSIRRNGGEGQGEGEGEGREKGKGGREVTCMIPSKIEIFILKEL